MGHATPRQTSPDGLVGKLTTSVSEPAAGMWLTLILAKDGCHLKHYLQFVDCLHCLQSRRRGWMITGQGGRLKRANTSFINTHLPLQMAVCHARRNEPPGRLTIFWAWAGSASQSLTFIDITLGPTPKPFCRRGPGPVQLPNPSLLSTGPRPAQPLTSMGHPPDLYWPEPLTSISKTPHFY